MRGELTATSCSDTRTYRDRHGNVPAMAHVAEQGPRRQVLSPARASGPKPSPTEVARVLMPLWDAGLFANLAFEFETFRTGTPLTCCNRPVARRCISAA
jgi:hypothetical protein